MPTGFIARRALRDAGVASVLRRSLTIWPRLLPGLLPLLVVAYAPVIVWGATSDLGSIDPGEGGWLQDASEAAAERWALYVQMALAGWSMLVSPIVGAACAKSAIRASFGERVHSGRVFGDAFVALPGALPSGLVAGLLTATAFGACFIPGFVIAAVLFPLGAVAAIERRPFGATFSRAAELTRGARLSLAGVAFLIGVIEAFVLRFASILVPRSMSRAGAERDLWIFAGLVLIVSLCATAWRAAASAIAYDELRVRAEDLEVDGVVRELGGQAFVGRDLGDAVTSERFVAMQRNRRGIAITIACVVVAALVYFIGKPFVDDFRDRREREARLQQYQRDAESMFEEQRRRAAEGAPAATPSSGLQAMDDSLVPEPPQEDSDEVVATRLTEAASAADKRRIIGQEVSPRAKRIYGPGFQGALRQLAKATEGQLELAVLPALGQELQGTGCAKAMTAAREAAGASQSATFSKSCPPGAEPRAIAAKKLEGVPLWAGALAVLLQMRARDAHVEKEVLHRAVVDALLSQREP